MISSVILNECIYGQFVLPPTNLDEYDAYGSLLAINEYLSILAQNDEERFSIITYPFTNRSTNCTLSYNTKENNVSSLTRFVYNVAIGAKQNASQLIFSYIDENWRRDVFLTIVFLNFTTTGCIELVNRTRVNMTDLKMQENGLVGMDPGGKWAYAIGTYYIVCVDVETGVDWQLNTEELLNNETNFGNLFFPKAFVVTEDQYIFLVGQRFTNFQFLPYLLVINFLPSSNITLFSSTELSKFNFGPLSVNITRYSSMSISLLDQIQQFIIGIPHLDMIIILSWDEKNVSKNPLIVQNYISSESGIYFGKSVALLDNNTFAVLAHMLPTLPWSTSQVQVSQPFS